MFFVGRMGHLVPTPILVINDQVAFLDTHVGNLSL
jgi:hypothetical protein